MKRETAEMVPPLLTAASARMNEAIAWAIEQEDTEAAQAFRRAGGQVMGGIYLDLIPEELRSPVTGR